MVNPELLQLVWYTKIGLVTLAFGLVTFIIFEAIYVATMIATAPRWGGGGSPFARTFTII